VSREGRRRWGFNERFVIGKQDNPMMERWRILQTPWGGLYVHFIFREDLDPVPHDHPWRFWRMVLKGGYLEEYFVQPSTGDLLKGFQTHLPLRPSRFPTEHAHRIVSVIPGTISLVLVGPKSRVWGFWDNGTWIDYRDALGLRPSEGVTDSNGRAV
jgi:hypothetical protein